MGSVGATRPLVAAEFVGRSHGYSAPGAGRLDHDVMWRQIAASGDDGVDRFSAAGERAYLLEAAEAMHERNAAAWNPPMPASAVRAIAAWSPGDAARVNATIDLRGTAPYTTRASTPLGIVAEYGTAAQLAAFVERWGRAIDRNALTYTDEAALDHSRHSATIAERPRRTTYSAPQRVVTSFVPPIQLVHALYGAAANEGRARDVRELRTKFRTLRTAKLYPEGHADYVALLWRLIYAGDLDDASAGIDLLPFDVVREIGM